MTEIELLKMFGPVVGLAIIIFILGSKGYWVYGRHYDRAIASADRWESIALNLLMTTQRAVSTSQQAIQKIPDPSPPQAGGNV